MLRKVTKEADNYVTAIFSFPEVGIDNASGVCDYMTRKYGQLVIAATDVRFTRSLTYGAGKKPHLEVFVGFSPLAIKILLTSSAFLYSLDVELTRMFASNGEEISLVEQAIHYYEMEVSDYLWTERSPNGDTETGEWSVKRNW